jgi:curved DNA-binding protein CbpA
MPAWNSKSDSEVKAALERELGRLRTARPQVALGVDGAASAAAIRAAFLALTKTYHPNRFARREREIKRLANEVYLRVKDAYADLAQEAPDAARGSPRVKLPSAAASVESAETGSEPVAPSGGEARSRAQTSTTPRASTTPEQILRAAARSRSRRIALPRRRATTRGRARSVDGLDSTSGVDEVEAGGRASADPGAASVFGTRTPEAARSRGVGYRTPPTGTRYDAQRSTPPTGTRYDAQRSTPPTGTRYDAGTRRPATPSPTQAQSSEDARAARSLRMSSELIQAAARSRASRESGPPFGSSSEPKRVPQRSIHPTPVAGTRIPTPPPTRPPTPPPTRPPTPPPTQPSTRAAAVTPASGADDLAQRARLLCQYGRWGDAARAFQALHAANPANASYAVQFHHASGRALHAAGDEAGARAEFERALRLDPSFIAAREALASLPAARKSLLDRLRGK